MIKSRIGDYQRSLEKNIFLSSSEQSEEDDIETFSREIFDDHRSEIYLIIIVSMYFQFYYSFLNPISF